MALHIMSVVGARPNFMKIAPFIRALKAHGDTVRHTLIHTGQHYDDAMSASFFRTLNIPDPDVDLGVGSGTHAEQVGRTMIAFEQVLKDKRPDWVVVVGDVNATCACSLTAAKERVRVAHIEAGLRSFDNRMPEEINRLVTDRLSDLLFTTDEIADANLAAEGVAPGRIRRVGNIMIDTLDVLRQRAEEIPLDRLVREAALGAGCAGNRTTEAVALRDGGFAVMTLHRPSNVDDPAVLDRLTNFVTQEIATRMPLVWALHPRTQSKLTAFGLWDRVAACPGLILTKPLGYLEMLRLNLGARIMITDSGGLQEECCVIGTPCLTLRENTERPVTLVSKGGVSELVGNDLARIRAATARMLAEPKRPHRPPLWDGHTAERIARMLVE